MFICRKGLLTRLDDAVCGIHAGHARIFEWSDSDDDWQPVGFDLNGDSNDFLGMGVAMSGSGTRVAVGAIDGCGDTSGHVRVYEEVENAVLAGLWAPVGDFIEGEAQEFGISLAMSSDGNRVVAGALGNLKQGDVRVFGWAGAGQFGVTPTDDWSQIGQTFRATAIADQFGWTVAMSSSGQRFVAGAHKDSLNGANSGKALVYQWSGIQWNQVGEQILRGEANDNFGYSVAMSGDGNRIAEQAGSGSSRIRPVIKNIWRKLPLAMTVFIGPALRKHISL